MAVSYRRLVFRKPIVQKPAMGFFVLGCGGEEKMMMRSGKKILTKILVIAMVFTVASIFFFSIAYAFDETNSEVVSGSVSCLREGNTITFEATDNT
ncbi:MAG: hypothetical protein PHW46_04125, partial [Candidatus Omnitrophica bacterium]|nr:hypothetical protein [Candidatus Omnitrophota bacterium]